MKRVKIFCVALTLAVFTSCNKKCNCDTEGTLKNYAGLDGCGWVIELDGKSEKLEPTNIDKFGIELSDGKKIKFSYKETGGMSICMVGKVAEITDMCSN
jgi:hypothetical protein